MPKRSEKEIQEAKEFLHIKKETIEREEVSIIFDGKQYSIRIPKRFVEATEIDTVKDKFIFKIVMPPLHSEREPRLTAELIRGKE